MAKAEAEAGGPSSSRGGITSKVKTLIPLINTIAVLLVLGVLLYTKVIYQRPPITEGGERARLATSPHLNSTAPTPGIMNFGPVSVNIASYPNEPKAADGTATQIQGKLHYAQLSFALEIRDQKWIDQVEPLRPILTDRILATIGKKNYTELTTVQGRYVLKTQILDLANEVSLKELKTKDVPVTNVFFSEFIVQ